MAKKNSKRAGKKRNNRHTSHKKNQFKDVKKQRSNNKASRKQKSGLKSKKNYITGQNNIAESTGSMQAEQKKAEVHNADNLPSTSLKIVQKTPSPKKPKSRALKEDHLKKPFKKFKDSPARKLLKRSRLMMQGKNYQRTERSLNSQNSPSKLSCAWNPTSPKNKVTTFSPKRRKLTTIEPHTSAIRGKPANNTTDIVDVEICNAEDSEDDDCVIIDNVSSHVTIVDDDDNNSSSSACDPLKSVLSNASRFSNARRPKRTFNARQQKKSFKPTFTIDVGKNIFMGKVAYKTVAPLMQCSQTEQELKTDRSLLTAEEKMPGKDLERPALNEISNPPLANQDNTLPAAKLIECPKESSESSSDSEEEEEDSETDTKGEDSVIFVSETNSDFIPIGGNKPHPARARAKVSKLSGQHYSKLLNKNEIRDLQKYNSNAYNPNAGKALNSGKRMIIIDGSNVAYKHSSDNDFSVKGISIAIEYFEKMGHEVKAVIPQFRMNFHKSTDPQELQRLSKAGKIVLTPCKNLPGLTSTSYDDRFILQLACELDAAVVSNDNYRDLMHESAAFKKIIESQVIGYTWCNDIFLLPKDPYGKWGPTLDQILNR